MSTKVTVVNGDIATIRADALITAINGGGMWAGGMDRVIAHYAGDQFHQQAAAAMPLTHGQVVLARMKHRHAGNFDHVLFVIDNLTGKLRTIVGAGLEAAHEFGLTAVTLPMIRMGVMLGIIERTEQEAVDELAIAVAEFIELHPESPLTQITVVVYNNPALEAMVRETLTRKLVA